MYNCKMKHYLDGNVQTQVFSNPVYTGKKSPRIIDDYVMCPFTNDYVKVIVGDMDDFHKNIQLNKNRSLRRTINAIYDVSRSNVWDWFITLTFDPNKVDSFDYKAVTRKLSVWLNNCRKVCDEDFKYVIVPEKHKSGRFHFHGLFANADQLNFVRSGKHSGNLDIYNIGKYKLGWSTATIVGNNEAVTKYITKYTTKDLMDATKGRKRYWASKNCDKPVVETSFLDLDERNKLHDELIQNATYFKKLEYEICLDNHYIKYYENKEDSESTPLLS